MKDIKDALYQGMLEAFDTIETGITRLLLKAPHATAEDVLMMIRESKKTFKVNLLSRSTKNQKLN